MMETYRERFARRQRQEMMELERDEVGKRQRELDFYWSLTHELDWPVEDEFEMVGGFMERRRPSCHRSRKDSDWDLR